MAGPRSAYRRTPLVALAGWLFADLMLVIMIVAIGSQSDPLAAHNAAGVHTTRPAPKPRPPTPTPTPTPAGPRSVEQNPVTIQVTGAGADAARLESELTAELQPYAGRQAGFVLTFGWGPEASSDTAYATAVNSLLLQFDPAMFPAGTPLRNFIDLGHSSGGAAIEIYFYTTP